MMDKEGVNEIIMDLDKNGKPLFSYPLDITSTRNGNIFVVDRLSNDSIGRVVVLSQNGEHIELSCCVEAHRHRKYNPHVTCFKDHYQVS
jgi:glucose dehydrogenase